VDPVFEHQGVVEFRLGYSGLGGAFVPEEGLVRVAFVYAEAAVQADGEIELRAGWPLSAALRYQNAASVRLRLRLSP
jgi:hypothetical protein